MAITIEQTPNGVNNADFPIVWRFTSTNVAEPKFRFICNVKIDSYDTNDLRTFDYKILPDPSSNGIIDVSKLIRDLVKPEILHFNGNLMFPDGVDPPLSKNKTRVYRVAIEYGESYVQGSDDFPTDTIIAETTQVYVIGGLGRKTRLIETLPDNGQMQGNQSEFLNYNLSTEISGSALDTGQTGTPLAKTIYISNNDHYTLSWLDQNVEGITTDTATSVIIKMVLEDNTFEFKTINNNSGNGGNDGSGMDNVIISVICGPKDMSTNTTYFSPSYRPEDGVDWKEYYVYLVDSSNAIISYQYRFVKRNRCAVNEHIQLQWVNRFGGWNYQSFQLMNRKSLEATTRKTYRESLGGILSTDDYGWNAYDKELAAYPDTGRYEWELTSDWMKESEYQETEDLFLSQEVYMYVAGSITPVPVVLTSRKWKRKTLKDDRLIQLEIKLKESQLIGW